MTDNKNNSVSRRYFLLATSTVTAVGAAATAIPFARSWTPSAKARALGAPISVDISKLQPGEIFAPVPAWRGQPIFIVHRTTAALEKLAGATRELADPESRKSIQPDYAVNATRSIRPEIGVFVGLCTHLGCSPKFYGKEQPEKFDSNWKGGFFCPCHGSKFDLAGRIEKNLPAPTNLVVPPYHFKSDNVIIVGEDAETA